MSDLFYLKTEWTELLQELRPKTKLPSTCQVVGYLDRFVGRLDTQPVLQAELVDTYRAAFAIVWAQHDCAPSILEHANTNEFRFAEHFGKNEQVSLFTIGMLDDDNGTRNVSLKIEEIIREFRTDVKTELNGFRFGESGYYSHAENRRFGDLLTSQCQQDAFDRLYDELESKDEVSIP